ncbi:PHD-finger domain-containing protein [Cryptosporidium andersoni]|uniref:PHD-finger domain-containing protein n=1 Tax=Cryptosporidium andersoni TaxID=117008 RepID=A0A1J4MTF6_9CRYT|nr:PHD-finger domain-containing protein [Cryptosporidium andersoni]
MNELNIFSNKYHLRCEYTGLTYCTCYEGSKSYSFHKIDDFESLSQNILPSTNFIHLLKLLAEYSDIHTNPKVEYLKKVKLTVERERNNFNERYIQELKRKHQMDMNKKIETNISKCYKCMNNPFRSNNTEDFIECSICKKNYHLTCCDPTIEKDSINNFKWICSNCNGCIVCRKSDREDYQVLCDICNRAFHIYCLYPTLDSVPQGIWICDDCYVCAFCQGNIKYNIEDKIEGDTSYLRSIDKRFNVRICINCREKNSDKILECIVCGDILEPSNNYICSHCRLPVHSKCFNKQLCNLCNSNVYI